LKISFLGGTRTVTGTQHLVRVNGSLVLLDCGLYQGRHQEAYERNRTFDFDPKELDAVILTHAHIDHSGSLPTLVKQGFRGKIYTTHVTTHLAEVMLLDSGSIQEQEAAFINKTRTMRGQEPVDPLYTRADAAKVADLFERVPYNRAFQPAPGVTTRLVEAGHILGSASVVLDVEEDGQTKRVWFSGDIGRLELPIVRDPVLPQDVDVLIMESTYGDRRHPEPAEALELLREALRRTFERGGRALIPAFAVGRTQDMVYSINQMMATGDLPKAPVYVDSPLAVVVSEIFENHPQYFDEEAQELMLAEKNRTALDFENLKYIDSVEESKALNREEGPMVIIATSGMVESGRILHHLRQGIGDPRNSIILVSYQAPHTLGRDLADGLEKVEILGDEFIRKAEVVVISGFSAHAGQDMLVDYACAVKDNQAQVYLVHGEPNQAEALRDTLQGMGFEKVAVPYLRQTIEI
jgi:metallo-beta-lactamase family protein